MLHLQSFFTVYNVSPEDREFWTSRLEKANDEMRTGILNLFREFPDRIGWFRVMQEKKEAAIVSGDEKIWQDIVEAEKHYLQTNLTPSEQQ